MRDEEDAFSNDVFSSIRSAFKRGMINTVKGKSKEQHRQLSEQQAQFDAKMARCRVAATRAQELAIMEEVKRIEGETAAHRTQVCPALQREAKTTREGAVVVVPGRTSCAGNGRRTGVDQSSRAAGQC